MIPPLHNISTKDSQPSLSQPIPGFKRPHSFLSAFRVSSQTPKQRLTGPCVDGNSMRHPRHGRLGGPGSFQCSWRVLPCQYILLIHLKLQSLGGRLTLEDRLGLVLSQRSHRICNAFVSRLIESCLRVRYWSCESGDSLEVAVAGVELTES